MLEFYQAYATYETLMDMTEDMLRTRRRAPRCGACPRRTRAGSAARALHARRAVRARPDARRGRATRSSKRRRCPAERAERRSRTAGRRRASRSGRRRRRARRIDWGNLARRMAKCDNDGERSSSPTSTSPSRSCPEDYRTQGRREEPARLHHRLPVRDVAARAPEGRRSRARRSVRALRRMAASSATPSASSTTRTIKPRAFATRSTSRPQGDEETMDYDEDYVRALEHGMPPAAGFGMGVDRLDDVDQRSRRSATSILVPAAAARRAQ